ncbi:probable 28S ribosomal protein S23, mitochondrial isoform X3 [Varroa destructor]|uniref:Small ribosomal subunit protein mS23 n=1 Tax=Varroa destructor TaxID=109461 RepID=A0A7M7M3G3_VARDE|nr:probable 28S ribosomal protein S23, mitochondrial isoform X3 [Varroa destructor]
MPFLFRLMAGSRVEKLGTVFSRTRGLLRAGGMKWKDRPIWYDIYNAYPPEIEPLYFREEPPVNPIRPILYKEDIIRAKFAKEVDRRSHPEQFMKMYNTALNETGSDSEAFARAVEKFRAVRKTEKRLGRPRVVVPDDAAAQTHAAKHTDIENDI